MAIPLLGNSTLGSGPSVALCRCPDYSPESVSTAVRRALEALPEVERLARPQRRVLLKPNLVNAQPPPTAVCTHPQVLRAVAEFFHEAGCSLLIADQPTFARPDQSDEVFGVTGYREALAHLPVAWSLAAAAGYQEHAVPRPWLRDTVPLSRLLGEVDFVLNLAKLKTHMQTRLTGAVKNVFGLVAPRVRMDLHSLGLGRLLSQGIADCFGAAPPMLSLLDAVVGMEGSGPTRGHPRALGWLAAGADAVALDALAASLTGFGPREIATTRSAAAAGYGCDDLAQISLLGDDPAPLHVRLRRAPRPAEHIPTWLGRFSRRFLYTRPRVDPRRCVGCGDCAAVCPASCIRLAESARIDRERCLECFCCMEACPHDAIAVSQGLLNRLR
jgi:uncharacterized protein (DUF362 family)/Pyruvate/2-oxoacid:ferredoxin oxidoreductase delta subunit